MSLPVLGVAGATIRPSRNSGRRAIVLIAVHILIIGHVVHWLLSGQTLSPVEPSEAMYTLNEGHLNAGFIFFASAIAATLIFGRFFCGWGCHLVAYQDLCAWLLKKVGVKPKPFRSRLLVLAPLALALYMFVWPSVYRLIAGQSFPTLSNHLVTHEFWATFPGLAIGAFTFAVCGFLIVYVLGGKGFCTYACPYGGFFGLVDPFAVGRIRVTDDCEQCGHCTATCTSNVRVHEEVAKFGMVVDPGCMKCMDCVSVCPNDALYFGFGRPSFRAAPNAPPRLRKYDFSLAEECLMIVIGLGALLAFRGLYNQIPLLLAMGLAAITAYLTLKLLHVLFRANVRFQNLQFKRGGRWTRSGVLFLALSVIWLALTAHSAAVQIHAWEGHRLARSLAIPDSVWMEGDTWWEQISEDQRSRVDRAIRRLHWVDRWGLAETPAALQELVWLHLARGDIAAAQSAVRRLIEAAPKMREAQRGLAGVLRRNGDWAGAEAHYRRAIELDSGFDRARLDLARLLVERSEFDKAVTVLREGLENGDGKKLAVELGELLIRMGRNEEAVTVLRRVIADDPDEPAVLAALGVAELQGGGTEAGVFYLRRAIEIEPQLTDARYNLAVALLGQAGQPYVSSESVGAELPARSPVPEAILHLERVVADRPEFAEAHYNLGVAKFMSGRVEEAAAHAREAIRLAPEDEQARAFLGMLLRLAEEHEMQD